MKRQLSEEQLDKLLRHLVNAAGADKATIDKVSDSPATWWGVQRRINEQKATVFSPWPPVGSVLRWLMISAPVAAAILLVISFFVFRSAEVSDKSVVASMPPAIKNVENTPEPLNVPVEKNILDHQPVIIPTKQAKHFRSAAKVSRAERHVVGETTVAASKAKKKEEIKTEFIALSYARDPESGQIVRVKVPSSMMVSLGVVASVKMPFDLVDAEVLVGDDGLTRAIRFIR